MSKTFLHKPVRPTVVNLRNSIKSPRYYYDMNRELFHLDGFFNLLIDHWFMQTHIKTMTIPTSCEYKVCNTKIEQNIEGKIPRL